MFIKQRIIAFFNRTAWKVYVFITVLNKQSRDSFNKRFQAKTV